MWLVRAGETEAVRGRVSLDLDALQFEPDDPGHPLPIPTSRIARARRLRLSPVVEVTYTTPRAEVATLLLYFAEPPALPGEARDRRPSLLSPGGGIWRMAAAGRLRRASRAKRRVVEGWAKAIREAAAR